MNPLLILDNPAQSNKRFRSLVTNLYSKGLVSAEDGDSARRLFSTLLETDSFRQRLQRYKDEIEGDRPRLDDFFWELIGSEEKFQALWKIVRKILTLSHGNATVCLGTSVVYLRVYHLNI